MKTKLTYQLLDSTMKEYHRITQSCPGTHQWIIRAKKQKEGKGREDRLWHSPEGGLWLTFDIYCQDFSPSFPLFIAYCLHSLLVELYSLENLKIKWPNDIMWQDKKLGGILCEHNEREQKYVIGLGLNTNIRENTFPKTLNAAVLLSLIGFPTSNKYLLELIISHINKNIHLLSNPNIYIDYINLWLYGKNQFAQAYIGNKVIIGKNIGIAENGTILLMDKEGNIQEINSGSLHFLPET
ncbi:MAG: biotin--[acetyl-CoA-carboxylase] ligase [Candidatus Cloacimonadaceae bacterium]|jgi:BirA family biotin operon repressor/biotin-[acetyl-CoA-carboxylase] ligase|nr:biotin--[acetyl-CoA-carboxylase] ligase [Candidatus Cloacimonadota bacterium]MDD5625112.1 biotin--[acetyl-CoA-carboxylase] ligase [Candidatus Cloacimonadota bacterium]MDY0111999.1 biotin--[acetyl-CoA-carboxylase] ligase [Candidatus Syntrophosphaera sp.]